MNGFEFDVRLSRVGAGSQDIRVMDAAPSVQARIKPYLFEDGVVSDKEGLFHFLIVEGYSFAMD